MTDIHPYFMEKTIRTLRRLGAEEFDPVPLAQWAQDYRNSDDLAPEPAAIVTADGTIIATASLRGFEPSVMRIDRTDKTCAMDAAGRPLDMGLIVIQRAIGQPVYAIMASDVARGPSGR